MRVPIPGVDPVALIIDSMETTGDLRFSGIDLDNGARITVVIERVPKDHTPTGPVHRPAKALVLVLTVETLEGRH